jgi:hypothetical protein
MKRELTGFHESFQAGTVSYNIQQTEDDGYEHGRDYVTDHDTLQALAEKRGATTWDESDILAHHEAVFGHKDIPLSESPAQRQAKEEAARKAAVETENAERPVAVIGEPAPEPAVDAG